VCIDRKTKVSIAKIKACIAPKNISRNKNGIGAIYGARKNTIVKRTSPAKTLPNNRKENEIILENSDKSSNMPTKNFIGFEKLKNFLICIRKPSAATPKKLVDKMAIIARARVKLRSLAGDLSNGILPSSLCKINEPTPGSNPSQLETRIKIKIVAISGRYFSDFFLSKKTESIRESRDSIKNSAIFWIMSGTDFIFFLNFHAKTDKIKSAIKDKNKPLVMA